MFTLTPQEQQQATKDAAATVEWLDRMIHEAVQMRDALSVLFAVPLNHPMATEQSAPATPEPQPGPEPAPAIPESEPRTAVKTPLRKVSSEKLYASLPEGFTVSKVRDLTGMEEKAAYSAIYRLRAKGLVENLGGGMWRKVVSES